MIRKDQAQKKVQLEIALSSMTHPIGYAIERMQQQWQFTFESVVR
jgi:hypothetical protein